MTPQRNIGAAVWSICQVQLRPTSVNCHSSSCIKHLQNYREQKIWWLFAVAHQQYAEGQPRHGVLLILNNTHLHTQRRRSICNAVNPSCFQKMQLFSKEANAKALNNYAPAVAKTFNPPKLVWPSKNAHRSPIASHIIMYHGIISRHYGTPAKMHLIIAAYCCAETWRGEHSVHFSAHTCNSSVYGIAGVSWM